MYLTYVDQNLGKFGVYVYQTPSLYRTAQHSTFFCCAVAVLQTVALYNTVQYSTFCTVLCTVLYLKIPNLLLCTAVTQQYTAAILISKFEKIVARNKSKNVNRTV